MDILQIAPMGCLISGFEVNAFGSLLGIMALNSVVISASVAVYGVRKAMILRKGDLESDEKSRKISEIKELLFRNLFFFLYVTYLSTCAQTASVLPVACQKLCRGDKEEFCLKYMKADYSVECQGENYNYWLSVAYIVGQESRSYIGLAWVIAGMYGMLFSWIKPIRDATENRLMATSLSVTVFNLVVGAVSRLPEENISVSVDTHMEAVSFKILVIGANTLVIGLLAVQYAMFLYGYIKEWRKNPDWSFSCCLALLVPLNDLQGDLRGLTEANVLKNQLETGQIEKPSILSAVQDTGVIDVILEEGDEPGEYRTKIIKMRYAGIQAAIEEPKQNYFGLLSLLPCYVGQ